MYNVFAEGIEVIKKAGVYSEESLVDNTFLVDIRLTFIEKPSIIPDYEMLCNDVIQAAEQGFEWIEEWIENIILKLSARFQGCKVLIKVRKKNPAFIHKNVQTVGVEYEQELK
ncbi:MAG: dihydroneopterin aldolase [Bacteroidia bacterium]|nr:dihydroneopterin aldolase [Bacteroidia bacterium]